MICVYTNAASKVVKLASDEVGGRGCGFEEGGGEGGGRGLVLFCWVDPSTLP